MNTLIHADIFFIIASVGFVLCTVLIAIALVAVIKLVKSVNRISSKVEASIDTVGDDAKELIEDLRESAVFRFIFGGRRRSRRSSQK